MTFIAIFSKPKVRNKQHNFNILNDIYTTAANDDVYDTLFYLWSTTTMTFHISPKVCYAHLLVPGVLIYIAFLTLLSSPATAAAKALTATSATASLTINQSVNGLAPTTDWEFSGLPTGVFTITASGGTQTLTVEPGDYTLAVTPKAGYTLEVDCGNGATTDNAVTLSLQDGDEVSCTFAATAQPATIRIVNQVGPVTPADPWQFTGPTGAFETPAVGGSVDFAPLRWRQAQKPRLLMSSWQPIR